MIIKYIYIIYIIFSLPCTLNNNKTETSLNCKVYQTRSVLVISKTYTAPKNIPIR